MLCFSMSQYMLAFMVPSMNCSSPVPAALMLPQTMTLSPPCLTVGKTHLSLYSSPGCRHTCLTPSEPNKFILVSSDHRTWFQKSISLVCLSSTNSLRAFLCIIFRRVKFPSGMTAMQTNLMQCAAYGLSTDRLTPHPFNLCSNTGSTHMSISQTQPSGYDAEHVHSTSLVDHGEDCSEWNLSC